MKKEVVMYYHVMSYNPDYSVRHDIVSLSVKEVSQINGNKDVTLKGVLCFEAGIDCNNLCGIYTSDKIEGDTMFSDKLYRIY